MQHYLKNIEVQVVLGKFDDSELDLVVKSQGIPLGFSPSGVIGDGGTTREFGITIKEATNADNVLQWPGLSILDPNRRETIYQTTKNALLTADGLQAVNVGFFTMGLEVSRIPSWEIAEEIVRALHEYTKKPTKIEKVFIVVSTPTQENSFEFALNNPTLIRQL